VESALPPLAEGHLHRFAYKIGTSNLLNRFLNQILTHIRPVVEVVVRKASTSIEISLDLFLESV
jgi:hypothetical protein